MESAFKKIRAACFLSSLDHFAFKLCYRWTALLLVTISFIVGGKLTLGYSFECESVPSKTAFYVRLYCYSNETYISPVKLVPEEKKSQVDIGKSIHDMRRYLDYYPWVSVFLLLQAFNFYLPHLLWKSYERGYLRRLTAGVQKFSGKAEERSLELCYLAKYVLVTQGKHVSYTVVYIFFESCNFLVSVCQSLWLVHFFNISGVPPNLPLEIETWSDFRNFYFPTTASCDFISQGASGIDILYRITCRLPLNFLYMKIFLFLYDWYIFLAILSGLVVIYRIALLFPFVRILEVRSSTAFLGEKLSLVSLCHKLSYSDWFFLSRLEKAMIDVDFAKMVNKINIFYKNVDKNHENRLSILEEDVKDITTSANNTSVL